MRRLSVDRTPVLRHRPRRSVRYRDRTIGLRSLSWSYVRLRDITLGLTGRLGSSGRNPLFADEAACRNAIRALARVVGSSAVLFSVVDEHIHLVLWCDRARCGRLAQAFVRAVRPLAAAFVEPARIRPVENRAHMKSLVSYVLSQPAHHGLPGHPALWSGSCFPDLIGARRIAGLELQLSNALPRFRMRDVYSAVGLREGLLAPLSLEEVRAAGIARVVSATGAALAVGPGLHGNGAPLVRARRVTAQLAQRAGMAPADIAWALDIAPRSARRLLQPQIDKSTIKAVRLRLALENVVSGQAPA